VLEVEVRIKRCNVIVTPSDVVARHVEAIVDAVGQELRERQRNAADAASKIKYLA
jgi:diacylglycerol kinase